MNNSLVKRLSIVPTIVSWLSAVTSNYRHISIIRCHSTRFAAKRLRILFLVGLSGVICQVHGEDSGNSVAVIYNSRLADSKKLAEYYAERRKIPTNQIFGLSLPETETISRAEFRDRLQKPLFKILEEQKLFGFTTDIEVATKTKPGRILRTLAASQIRYLVLC